MLIYLALISCAPAKAEQTFELHREQNTIFFKGKIENASARALIDQIHSGISLIVISSEGGSVKDALEVASAIRNHQVTLQVQDYCLSSCANYLFVAAAQKKLMPGAVLGFHGGAPDPAENQHQAESAKKGQLGSEIDKLANDQELFYRSVGFDPRLIHISALLTIATSSLIYELEFDDDKQVHTFTSKDELARFLKKSMANRKFQLKVVRPTSKVYFPNESILTKYGVKGITDYPYPADQAALDALGEALGIELIGDFVK